MSGSASINTVVFYDFVVIIIVVFAVVTPNKIIIIFSFSDSIQCLNVDTAVEHTPIDPMLHNPVSFTACVIHADTDTSVAIKGASPAITVYSSSSRVLHVPAGR